jgi:hypoxanthine-guanine phosphoribosyltransferase
LDKKFAEILQVPSARELRIEVGFLRHNADELLYGYGIPLDVEVAYRYLSGIAVKEAT